MSRTSGSSSTQNRSSTLSYPWTTCMGAAVAAAVGSGRGSSGPGAAGAAVDAGTSALRSWASFAASSRSRSSSAETAGPSGGTATSGALGGVLIQARDVAAAGAFASGGGGGGAGGAGSLGLGSADTRSHSARSRCSSRLVAPWGCCSCRAERGGQPPSPSRERRGADRWPRAGRERHSESGIHVRLELGVVRAPPGRGRLPRNDRPSIVAEVPPPLLLPRHGHLESFSLRVNCDEDRAGDEPCRAGR